MFPWAVRLIVHVNLFLAFFLLFTDWRMYGYAFSGYLMAVWLYWEGQFMANELQYEQMRNIIEVHLGEEDDDECD